MEIYKDIKGYEGLYQISNKGNVKTLPKYRRSGNGFTLRPEKIMKQSINRTGYNRIGLKKDGKIKQHLVSRLVAMHFIDNPDKKPCVNHVDENKKNNTIENLEWVTHKENMNARGLGKRMKAKFKLSNSKPLYQYTKDGVFIKKWDSGLQAQKAGYTGTAISACVHGHQNSHAGYVWSLKPLHGKNYIFKIDNEKRMVFAHDLKTALMYLSKFIANENFKLIEYIGKI